MKLADAAMAFTIVVLLIGLLIMSKSHDNYIRLVGDIDHLRAVKVRCESEIPRNKECQLVITAEVKDE